MLKYIDWHTHFASIHWPDIAGLISITPEEFESGILENPCKKEDCFYSLQLHPWQVELRGVDEKFIQLASNAEISALGECGFDRLRGPGLERQSEVFEQLMRLAEQCDKPLVIHCVRAFDLLVKFRRRTSSPRPWLIHGFHGKWPLIKELIKSNCLLSLNAQGVKNLSGALDKTQKMEILPFIGLESDGRSDYTVKDLYHQISVLWEIDEARLVEVLQHNFRYFIGEIKR